MVSNGNTEEDMRSFFAEETAKAGATETCEQRRRHETDDAPSSQGEDDDEIVRLLDRIFEGNDNARSKSPARGRRPAARSRKRATHTHTHANDPTRASDDKYYEASVDEQVVKARLVTLDNVLFTKHGHVWKDLPGWDAWAPVCSTTEANFS